MLFIDDPATLLSLLTHKLSFINYIINIFNHCKINKAYCRWFKDQFQFLGLSHPKSSMLLIVLHTEDSLIKGPHSQQNSIMWHENFYSYHYTNPWNMFVGVAKLQKYFQIICYRLLQLPPLHDSKTTNAKGMVFFTQIHFVSFSTWLF